MPRPSIYRNDPCDIKLTPVQRMMLFDAGLTVTVFYWTIHDTVVLAIKGRSDVVIAATPPLAIHEAITNGGL